MRRLNQLLMKLRMIFHRSHAATQLNDELSFHLDQQIAENIARIGRIRPAKAQREWQQTWRPTWKPW